nr:hypothetical protein [uncultured bacterium]
MMVMPLDYLKKSFLNFLLYHYPLIKLSMRKRVKTLNASLYQIYRQYVKVYVVNIKSSKNSFQH